MLVGVITFSHTATVHTDPTPPENLSRFTFTPFGGTNIAAALKLASKVHAKVAPGDELLVVLCSDGDASFGGGITRNHAGAAIKKAEELRAKGARLACIGFAGGGYDFDTLRKIASSPSLFWRANEGSLASIFVQTSQRITQQGTRNDRDRLLLFLIDTSISMEEAGKQRECEEAVNAGFAFLRDTFGR